MEPRIQYAKTKDGVSIAYWTLGEGPALLHGPNQVSHIGLEWEYPEIRNWYERLAQRHRLVRFDWRGMGLSEPTLELSLESFVLDIEAIVDRLGLDTLSMLALAHSCPVAITYAVRHPEKLSHLLLWNGYARADEWLRSPEVQALRALANTDWETYAETTAQIYYGWSAGEPARRFARLVKASFTPEYLDVVLPQLNTWDVADILPEVRTPTLILHRREMRMVDVSVARSLAARIPDARLALLEGTLPAPYLGDADAVLNAIEGFLSDGGIAEPPAPAPTGLVTVLFTDITDSTALTQRLGDARAQELVRAHNAIVRDALKAHRGSEIKHTGDGIMASFTTASGALECAVAIQRNMEQGTRNMALPHPIAVHIGLNAGEPVAEEQDLFGTAVQLARRICDAAAGGEILASDVVRQLAAGKGFLFADRGEVALRGFEDPVRVYEVRWRADS